MPETKKSKSKGPQAAFTYCGGKFPGICYLTGKAGKTYYAKYIAIDGTAHFEKIGTESEGWTKAKVRDERADRKRRIVPTNLERREFAKAAAEIKAIAIAENAVTDDTTFGEYATAWLERRKADLAPSTYRDYKSAFKKHVLPHLGKIPIAKIDYKVIEDFVAKIEGVSAKRSNNIMVPVKSLLSNAKKRGDITKNPAEDIPRSNEVEPEADPLSIEEMRVFLANVDPRYVAYFSMAFFTGMRPNEMIALKWSRVDFELKVISVREGRVQGVEGPPKTKASIRDVDILPPLFEILRHHRMTSPADAVYVFTNTMSGPLEVNNLRNNVWAPTLEKANLRKRAMYQTRHTFASLMLLHGEDILWVARMLGHTSPAMIYKHYAKFIRNRDRRDGAKFLVGYDEADATLKSIAAGVDASVEVPT